MSVNIKIDYCFNCHLHTWCTRHNEAQYADYYKKVRDAIIKDIPDAVITNVGAALKEQGMDPKIGAFEVYVQKPNTEQWVVISSKLRSGRWPNPGDISKRIAEVKAGTWKDLYKKVDKPPPNTARNYMSPRSQQKSGDAGPWSARSAPPQKNNSSLNNTNNSSYNGGNSTARTHTSGSTNANPNNNDQLWSARSNNDQLWSERQKQTPKQRKQVKPKAWGAPNKPQDANRPWRAAPPSSPRKPKSKAKSRPLGTNVTAENDPLMQFTSLSLPPIKMGQVQQPTAVFSDQKQVSDRTDRAQTFGTHNNKKPTAPTSARSGGKGGVTRPSPRPPAGPKPKSKGAGRGGKARPPPVHMPKKLDHPQRPQAVVASSNHTSKEVKYCESHDMSVNSISEAATPRGNVPFPSVSLEAAASQSAAPAVNIPNQVSYQIDVQGNNSNSNNYNAADSRGINSNFDSVEGNYSNAKNSGGAPTVATVVDGQTFSIVAPKKYSVPETVMSRKSQKRMMWNPDNAPPPVVVRRVKQAQVGAVAFDPTGSSLFAIDHEGDIRIYDMAKGGSGTIKTWAHSSELGISAQVYGACWTDDGYILAGGRWTSTSCN